MTNFPYIELINPDVSARKLRRNLITVSIALIITAHIDYSMFTFPKEPKSTPMILFKYFVDYGHNMTTTILFCCTLYLLTIHVFELNSDRQKLLRQQLSEEQNLLRTHINERKKKDFASAKESSKRNKNNFNVLCKMVNGAESQSTTNKNKIKEIARDAEIHHQKLESVEQSIKNDNYNYITRQYAPLFLAGFALVKVAIIFLFY